MRTYIFCHSKVRRSKVYNWILDFMYCSQHIVEKISLFYLNILLDILVYTPLHFSIVCTRTTGERRGVMSTPPPPPQKKKK